MIANGHGQLSRLPGTLLVAAAVLLLAVAMTAGCTRSNSDKSSTEGELYEQAIARIPMDGMPDRPLYWDVPNLPEPDATEAVRVARHFEALDHMLIFGPVPRRSEDLDLLWLLATDARAERTHSMHVGVDGTSPDPWLGPQWIRVVDAAVEEDEATVTMCFDQGFFGPRSRGGGAEMWLDHRWVLMKYDLVREHTNGDEGQWKVDRVASYSDNYPDPSVDLDKQCEEWATHTLEDAE